jgi:hypothetical protein
LFSDYTASVRATLHRFLLMLLMLALPLQSFASVAVPGCMATDAAQASLPAMAPMAMDGEMMAGCHEHEQPDSSAPTHHDCKHCATCALASALPIPVTDTGTPAIVPVSTRFIAHPAASFSGFIPDGPERPPRLSLA